MRGVRNPPATGAQPMFVGALEECEKTLSLSLSFPRLEGTPPREQPVSLSLSLCRSLLVICAAAGKQLEQSHQAATIKLPICACFGMRSKGARQRISRFGQ